MRRWVALLVCSAAVVPSAQAAVFKCVDRDGQVIYANSPCEAHGARPERRLERHELRGNVVRMPTRSRRGAPAAEGTAQAGAAGGEWAGLDGPIREGPADGRAGGVRSVVLEHLRTRSQPPAGRR